MRRRLSVGQALQDPPMKTLRNKKKGRKQKRLTQTWTNSVGHNGSEGYESYHLHSNCVLVSHWRNYWKLFARSIRQPS